MASPNRIGYRDTVAIRTTSAATSRRVIGRPRPRRALPSYVLATSLRYQRRIVSGVTMPATCIKTRRPSFWPRTASRPRRRFNFRA